jgi:hypothetical protein
VSPLLRHQKLCSPTVRFLPNSRNTFSTPASPLSLSEKDGSSTSLLLPLSSNKPTSDFVGVTGRRSEVGFVSERRPEPFLLSFERAPVWLLALEPSVCSAVFFVGVPKSSWRSLIPEAKIPPCSIERWLGLAWFEFHYCGKKPPPDNAITLVSGSYPFLQRAASNSGLGRKIFLLDEPWRRKIEPNPSYGFIWKILLPSQFGSSTDIRFWWVFLDFRLLHGDLLWRAISDTFWTIPFDHFPLPLRK